MKSIRITRAQFEELRSIQIKYRMDWPAAFSTNEHGDLWLFAGRSWTHPHKRVDVRGVFLILDQVADLYTVLREEGGRFFVDDRGVFWKNQSTQQQFVQWLFE
jgi:hypothetical protein